jgi:tetratricopeptide (TPR) repeat protein
MKLNLMKRILLLFFFLALFIDKSFSQARLENRNKFFQAENFVLYEEYKEALPLYMELLKVDPANANFKYRIGQCLMSIPGRKKEAVSYLEDAVKNINLKYKEGKFKENKSPYDAYYYLANAYRINNQLPKALETYEIFKKNMNPAVYDTALVNLQILSCRNAIEIMKVPLYIRKVNLGSVINSRYSDVNPVVSDDETVMVYSTAEQYQDALYFTKKVNGRWTAPRNIIPDLGLGFEEKNFPTSISSDGRELYIYRQGADYDGNIFVTRRDKNDKWSNLVRLNDNINTKYWESHATISHDGKKLYFTSNRKGSYGGERGLDIYVSERDSTGDWGPAKNLGPNINTVYSEESPFLGKDDKTLFFSSRGHLNIGGYDVFYSSKLANGEWSVPLNMGYPLNSTDDDLFFDPVNDGYQAFYAIDDSGGFGLQDIYRIEIFSKDHPRKFFVRGIVQVKDLQYLFRDSVKISAFNREDPNASVIVYSDPATGEYKFEVPQGNYSLAFEAAGAEKTIKNLDLPLTSPLDSFVLPGTTLPKTDFAADMIVESNKTISVVKGDTISFPLRVEPKSVLIVEHWLGDSLLSTEKFLIKDTLFVYKTVPLTGNNKIVFRLTDKFNNTTTSEIFINREKMVAVQPVVKPEYSRVIAQKQIIAFGNILKKREDEILKNVIQHSNFEKQKFGSVDDIISFLKEEAAKSSISPDAVDKLALKIGVMDNVLTQAAVDLIARNSRGEMKEILSALNINEAGLKTWTDLQNYLAEKSNGRIHLEDLDKIASDILSDIDPTIAKLREMILAFCKSAPSGNLIKQSVATTDLKNIKNAGSWLQSVYNESILANVRDSEMAGLFAVLSAMPDTDGSSFLEELKEYSDEKLRAYFDSQSFKKSDKKTPYDIIIGLLKNKDKGFFPDSSLFDALSKLIFAKNIPIDTITSQKTSDHGNNLIIFWVILGTGLIFFYFIYSRRKKRNT